MSAGNAGSGNGGGSPNQMAKDKAAKDKAVRDKEARQKQIREEQNNKQKVTVPEKKTNFKPVTKEVLNPNNNIQEKKKTPIIDFIKGGGVAGAIVRGVSGAIQKSKTKKEANVEVGLGKDRISNYKVGGNDSGQGTGAEKKSNAVIKEVTKTAPTTIEVSQATTASAKPTETAETTEANRLLKIKKRGRSQSIMTSSKGVTKTSANYSLGKKSLLGRI